jgi:hypothetical protein
LIIYSSMMLSQKVVIPPKAGIQYVINN